MPLTCSSKPAVCCMRLRIVTGLPSYGGILKSRYWLTSRVEIDLARLDELHDRGPGDELRDRPGPEQRQLRIDRRALGDVGIAVAALREHLPVLDDRDRGAGDVAGVQRVGKITVEPGIDVLRREFMSARADGRRRGGGGRGCAAAAAAWRARRARPPSSSRAATAPRRSFLFQACYLQLRITLVVQAGHARQAETSTSNSVPPRIGSATGRFEPLALLRKQRASRRPHRGSRCSG